MQAYSFNTLGMCILRDIFSFNDMTDYTIHCFLQSVHPAVHFMYNAKPKTPIGMKELDRTEAQKKIRNFRKKCVMNDYNGTVLEAYEKKSDYFLLDLPIMVHTTLIKETTDEGASEHYFTNSAFCIQLRRAGFSEFFSDKKTERIPVPKLWEELDWREVLDRYIFWLTEVKGYSPENIIIVENRSVRYYTDGNALFALDREPYTELYQRNGLLQEMYRYFENKCRGCYVIKMPCSVYGDKYHIWGLNDLHYCFEFYEYAGKCLRVITDGTGDKRKKLEDLYEEYSRILMEKTYELMRNSFLYAGSRNWLDGNLCRAVSDGFFAPKGTEYFDSMRTRERKGELPHALPVRPYGTNYGKVAVKGKMCYVDIETCVTGCTGTNQQMGTGWYTQNSTTQVQLTECSAIISHNGKSSPAQTQIIQVVKDNEKLSGKPVVISVWARVLKKNRDGKGGSIAIINENGYNEGKLFAYRNFDNESWERVVCSVFLPVGEDFKGVTVCLRALVAKEAFDGAVVEFKSPKLEIGAFPTA